MTRQQTILSYISEGFSRLFSIYPPLPRRIQLEITNNCNFNCNMCQRTYFNLPEKDMSLQTFHKALSWFSDVADIREIIFGGWGETLMNPDIINMISEVKERNYNLSITTNGFLLKCEMFDNILKSGLDNLIISIEELEESTTGHPHGLRVSENIINLLKGRGKNKKPRIILRTTLHYGKAEKLYELAQFAREKKVDVFQITRLDVRFDPNLKRPDSVEEKRMILEIDKILRGSQTELSCTYISRGGGVKGLLFSSFRNYLHRCGKDCPKIFDYLYITVDGEITPCCSLPRFIIGNIKNDSVDEVWNGEKLLLFRKNQSKICGVCDVPFVKQITI